MCDVLPENYLASVMWNEIGLGMHKVLHAWSTNSAVGVGEYFRSSLEYFTRRGTVYVYCVLLVRSKIPAPKAANIRYVHTSKEAQKVSVHVS